MKRHQERSCGLYEKVSKKHNVLYMYGSSKTVVSCAAPRISFEPLLVMDRWTDEARQESLWTMMFANDNVICIKRREQWRNI